MTTAVVKRAPPWFTDYFEAALDRHQRLSRIVDVSAAGIMSVRAMPNVLDVLARAKGEEQDLNTLTIAKERASLAEQEVEQNFPTLTSFGVLALWSWLESFVLDFAVLWLQHKSGALQSIKAPRFKVDLAEYSRFRGRDRARFVVDMLDREGGGPLRMGVGRFDAILEAVGFHVALEDQIRRDLCEFQQVRNCYSHRFGVVDKRLKDACPWMKLKVGQALMLGPADFTRYSFASAAFLTELLVQGGELFGIDLSDLTGKSGPPIERTKAQRNRK